jgi:TIR domain
VKDHIFISYSHQDDTYRVELETHLKPYRRNGSITIWSDEQIRPGSEWEPEIDAALRNSRIAVLLVSSDFLNSAFIHENELGPLLKRAQENEVKILWIPIRPSGYEQTPLKNYQALSRTDRPLSGMTKAKRDETWVEICKKIHREVNAIKATPDLPEPVSPSQPAEPEVTPAPIAETMPPERTPLSSGQQSIANATLQVAAERDRENAQLEALRQERRSRATLKELSWTTIRKLFDRLCQQIRDVAPDVERFQGDYEPSLLLQWGTADLEFTPINVDAYRFNQSGWDILNGFHLSVSQIQPQYNWSGNLFLLRRPQDQSFRWYEVAYFESGLIRKTRPAPFGTKNKDEFQNVDEAAAGVVGTWQLAYGPIPIESDHEQSFHDRWMERFAQAAIGELREPQLPLPPPNAPTSHSAAPAVLAIVAATSVLVALSEEREAFLELAAKDPRAAMKNSWEGLAKDILRAGNVEMGRIDPDSPAIGHALQRLHHSTHYAAGLVAELTQLQITARTLFNQSKWAYDPQDAEARQYILRCEQARQKLQQAE